MRRRLSTVRGLVRAFSLVTLVTAASAFAGEREGFRLTYAVPGDASCPDEASFRNFVAARLGYDPFETDRSGTVRVDLTRDRGKLRARTEVTRRGDKAPTARELFGDADQCEALDEALATSLAIALDPVRALAPVPPPPPPRQALASPLPSSTASSVVPPSVPLSVPPRPSEARPPAPEAQPGPSASFFGGLGFVASIAAAPTVSLGGDLMLGMRVRSFSLEAEGRAETTPVAVTESSGDRLEGTILSGALYPCASFGAWSGCVFLRMGAFQGYAPDVTQPHLSSSVYASTGLRLGYVIPISRVFAFRPSLEGAIALTRTMLGISNVNVWTAPPVTASVTLALLANIP